MHKKRQMYAKVGVLEEAIPMKKNNKNDLFF